MTEVLDRFEQEYQQYHGLTAARRVRQHNALEAFAEHAGKPLLECDGEDLAAFLADLVKQGLHVNTVRTRGNMIRPFYSWCYSVKLIDGERLMSIRAVRNPNGATGRSLPKPYSNKELAKWRLALDDRYPLLEEFKLSYWRRGTAGYGFVADHAQRIQIEAIVGLALYCGMRRGEIYDASIDDMHPDNAYVVVRKGKGDKPREVPHTTKSRELVEAWLEFREELGPDHDFPWLSLAPNQPEPGWLKPMRYRRYEQLLTNVGDWTLHRFRHTAATNWLRAGMPLELVSRLLGHAGISQTLMYAELVPDDIQRAVEKHEAAFERQINGTAK